MRREELLALAPRIRAITAGHGAVNLAAFDPVAGDEAVSRSDLDRLALTHELGHALHCRVDLIRCRTLRPEALVEAEREALPLG
jgi:predicted nucleotidyltransferase